MYFYRVNIWLYQISCWYTTYSAINFNHISHQNKTRNRIFNQFPEIYTKQNIKKRQIQGSLGIERKLRLDIALDVVPKFCKVITSFLFCTSIVWYSQYFLFLFLTFTSIEMSTAVYSNKVLNLWITRNLIYDKFCLSVYFIDEPKGGLVHLLTITHGSDLRFFRLLLL